MLKLFAALYVAAVLTWIACWIIRKADKYFWRGVAYGVLWSGGYALFLCSALYLWKGSPL